VEITRSSLETGRGPSDWFTGDVYIDTIAVPAQDSRVNASAVHFTPGARTAWHTHPNGQTIFVLEGVGLSNAAAARSRSSAPVTASFSSPARSTGTAPQRPGS
jgi:quercetin dioxygenase-like cupin family protein